MRKLFVVLVSLYINLVHGLIVPSSIPEFIDEEAAILAENDATKLDEMKLNTIEPGFVSSLMPDSGAITNDDIKTFEKVRKIDENELYENSIDKENKVNERSYVYINQKFKSSVRKGFHRSKHLDNHSPVKNIFIPPMTQKDATNMTPLPTKLSYGFFQPSMSEMLIKDVKDNYILSKNECKDCLKPKKTPGLRHRNYDKLKTGNKGIDEELNYIELLKPPYVRTLNKNSKIQYHYPNISRSSTIVLNQNLYNDKKDSNSETPSTAIPKEIKTLRRLHTAQEPALGRNTIGYKEENFIFDDSPYQTYRPLEETSEERSEMGRFQKNTYGEQITNEKVNINYDHCNYKDCILTNKKIQRKANKSKCKCSVPAVIKINNIQQENLDKGKMKTNKTTVKMNSDDRRLWEDSDYDILVENASRSVDDELMKTVNR